MKEIKFRAWHKGGFMAKVEIICNTLQEAFIYYVNPQAKLEFLNVSFNDIELMQYTGLKDKNGTEIYEGDIITFHGEAGKVEFFDGSFCVILGDDKIPLKISNLKRSKILGNIYENKN